MMSDYWMTQHGEVKVSPLEAGILKHAEVHRCWSPRARAIVAAADKFAEWKAR